MLIIQLNKLTYTLILKFQNEILIHNAIEMNVQNLFIFLFIYSLLDTLLVLYIVFKSKTIVYGLIEIMIAIIMSTVSLLTIEHNKALAKKDYSSSKDSGGGGGGSDSSSGGGSGSSGKKDTSSNSDSKKFRAYVSLDISL